MAASQQAPQQIPLKISVAPFPEGWEGDMDEYGQQLVQLMEAYIEGNFLTGLILPPGTTLPTTDQGPIAMGGIWYFYDPSTQQYLPQTMSAKLARNHVKNATYLIAQLSTMAASFTVPSGDTLTYDMVLTRATIASVLAIDQQTGPPASGDTDNCLSAIRYTVGPTLVPALAATDRFIHEHLIEGSDIVMIQGEVLTLGFSVYTNVPGTYSVYLTNGARDASFIANFTIQTANVWQRVRIAGIPAMPVGTIGTWSGNFGEGQTGLRIGVVMAIGSNFQTATGNLNKWIAGAFCGTANNSNLCTVVNNQFRISGVKLEASTSATYLTVNSFEQDYHDASRYYWTGFNYQSVTAGVPLRLRAPYNGAWSAQDFFPRRMAKVPVVTPYGYSSHAPGNITNIHSGSPIDIPVAIIAATAKGIVDGQSVALGSTTVLTGTVTALSIVGNIVTGSTQVAAISVAESQNVLPGAGISGTGIPAGAKVVSYDSTGQILSISLAATATTNNLTISVDSPIITALSSTAALAVGMSVTGTGVLAGALLQAIISGTSVQLSQPVVPGTGISFTFGSTSISSGDVLLAYVIADARLT